MLEAASQDLSICSTSLSFPNFLTQHHVRHQVLLLDLYLLPFHGLLVGSARSFATPVPQTLLPPSPSCGLMGLVPTLQPALLLPLLDSFLVSHPILISKELHHHLGLHSLKPESSLTSFTPPTHHPSVSPSCQVLLEGGSWQPPPHSNQSLPEPNYEHFDIWAIHPSTHHPTIIHC